MAGFSTGLSALTTSQRQLDLIGHNIANANTPGYHRQVAVLGSAAPTEVNGFSIGAGVQITDIRRVHSRLVESALHRNRYDLGSTTAQLDAMRQVETVLATGDGSVHGLLEKFFNDLEQLTARPDDVALRRVVLGTAAALVQEIRSVSGDFQRLEEEARAELGAQVGEVNRLARQIAELNAAIQRSEARGIAANDQRDQRDQLIAEAAGLVDVQTVETEHGQTTVLAGGAALVVGSHAGELAFSVNSQGQAVITASGIAEPLAVSGGRIGGLLETHNRSLPDLAGGLDEIARTLVREVNAVHATGLGLSGPFTLLSAGQDVAQPSLPLAQAGLSFAPRAGSLFVTVSELATGARTLHEVTIDPATQSLDDVAAVINGLDHLQAVVDPQTGQLRLLAETGYGFDFAGRLETAPDSGTITGTSTPLLDGRYRGAANDEWTFEVVGSGTVGVTPNLALRVENAAGGLVALVNIGQGYEPSSAIDIGEGVTLRLASGTLNNGDTFSTHVVAQADTAGILGSLGLAGFFTGNEAANIGLASDVTRDPNRLAASLSGHAGDSANLARLAALRDAPLLGNATQSFRQAYAALVGDAGATVQELTARESHQELLAQHLQTQQQSISGVDPNEELVRLVQFQRMFQMAARYVSVLDQTLNELFQIIQPHAPLHENDMDLRVTSLAMLNRSLASTREHSARLARLQEQAATGNRILRPSDAPADTVAVLANRAQDSRLEAWQSNISDATTTLDINVSALREATSILSSAREIAIEGNSSTNDASAREAMAQQLDALLERLLAVGNTQYLGRYTFAGAATQTAPFRVEARDALGRPLAISYEGAGQRGEVAVDRDQSVATLYSGEELFQSRRREPTVYSVTGVATATGARAGTGTDSATGRGTLLVRHTATTYAAGSGVAAGTASVAGDTIIGPAAAHRVTIDDTSGTGASGTISLNGGPSVSWSNADANLQVSGPGGEIVFVDTTAIVAGFNGDVDITAAGTLSTDGGASEIAIDFSGNQVVASSITGKVTHVDSQQVRMSGANRLDYRGTYDAFQVLMAVRDDLRNAAGLSDPQVAESLSNRLGELDRARTGILGAMGEQASSLQNLEALTARMADMRIEVQSRTSELESADISEVVLGLQAQENQLRLVLAATARVLDVSLLDFLG